MNKKFAYSKSAIKRKKIANLIDSQANKEYKQSMNRLSGNLLDAFRLEFIEVMENNLELDSEDRNLIEEILDESIKNSKIIFTTNIMKTKKNKF
jgi:hypothetical protein